MRFLPLLLLLAGCSAPYLTVSTRYDTLERLASSYVQTPDPRRCDPWSQGQTLILQWIVPETEGYWIELTRVYRCHERETDAFCLNGRAGRYEIPLRGEDYIEKGGYLSYQAILFHRGEAVKVIEHPLFVQPIALTREQKRTQREKTTQ